ncbi:molybdopterin molybdotransferase MoeA [Cytobacillus purgationiresistens]|uniref:Molybdopterin molybdenumtransferase n=1 Tax=Cytobacillus purgationiresistens TaxID=863449 RepID=A0ABU0ABY7_9BACI|nr:gephyrin-like molybdotransferase Glp [Cytobacillus purgationiresistens]MDQ0268768.1 molybdopterin molybdotransferase [Cytobacillus purgationiresistens]
MVVERRTPIQVGEAVQKLMKFKQQGEVEFVHITQSNNRYLAEDLKATSDVPHFDRSPYDGFAVRSTDTQTASLSNEVEFEVVDHIGAGYVSSKEIGPFQAVRIMTGAQMPENCDAVVMLELAKTYEKDGKPHMTIKRSYRHGDNVSFKGEDALKGDSLVEKGTRINPGIQAILATFGYAEVPVVKKPVIGLFATGTELLEVDDDLQPGKIRNSNSIMLAAQIERAGAEVKYYGKLADEFDTCYNAVKTAVDEVDMLITTGGVSVGDFDYLPAIYKKMEAEVLFNKVAMRPGSVTTVAQLNGKLLFGLSGNPSACYVGFELFTRPIIRYMLLSQKPHLRKETAILKADFPKANPFTRFVRATVSVENGQLITSPSGVDKSNIVMSLAGANALMALPGGTRGYGENNEVDVFMLEDFTGSEWPW